ncbi:hypothetical protein G7Y89_g10786 [Cudoniella acicularis]|uniref:Uncharacterized protein n=1 Tax=Cudoniella acicularis TaxID=354080 RepID=A0A8H4VYW2_9HELO|nr:hypothetical protein G7Y89_g10786 [Cudoniella acicularis]
MSNTESLADTLSPRNYLTDNGNTTDSLLSLIPVTYKLVLPWWTQIPSTVLDFLLAAWTVTMAWESRGTPKGDKYSPWHKVAHKGMHFIYLSIQSLSGLIHLAINYQNGSISATQRPGGNTFVALFAASTQLWHKTTLEYPRTLLVAGWINVGLALLYLVLLSLPVVGSGPVFQAWCTGCSYIVNSGNDTSNWNSNCGNFAWNNGTDIPDAFGQTTNYGMQFTCATMQQLGLGGADAKITQIESYFSWFFVAFIVLLLLGSIWTQFTNPIERNEHRALTFVVFLTFEPGPIMRYTILLTTLYAAVWIGLTWFTQNSGFNASVMVCPNIANSTVGPVTMSNTTCTCVDISRSYAKKNPGGFGWRQFGFAKIDFELLIAVYELIEH